MSLATDRLGGLFLVESVLMLLLSIHFDER